MSWKGDKCWYCGADLPALMGLPDCFEELANEEFDRHMEGQCMAAPKTDWERRAAELVAQEMRDEGIDLHELR